MSYNLDDVMRRADMDPNDIIKHSKLLMMLKYQQAKEENPNLNQEQICGLIGTSKSKVYRNRIDLNMDSFHRYKVPVKHRAKPKTKSDSEDPNSEDPNSDRESQKSSTKSSTKKTSTKSSKKSRSKSSREPEEKSRSKSKNPGEEKSSKSSKSKIVEFEIKSGCGETGEPDLDPFGEFGKNLGI